MSSLNGSSQEEEEEGPKNREACPKEVKNITQLLQEKPLLPLPLPLPLQRSLFREKSKTSPFFVASLVCDAATDVVDEGADTDEVDDDERC